MQINKYKIKLNYNDLNIKIDLKSNDNQLGYQQEINSLTDDVATSLINPTIDYETKRFKYVSSNNVDDKLKFYFSNHLGNIQCSLLFDFESYELKKLYNNVLNSFFLLEFYDSYDLYNKRLISRVYNTKILNSDETETSDDGAVKKPLYILNKQTNQFSYLTIPQWFLDEYDSDIITGYTKFKFYSAKTADITYFYNYDNIGVYTNKFEYFITVLNKLNNTWYFISNKFKAYEIPSASSFINSSKSKYNNYSNDKTNYPTGSTFNNDGTYSIV